MNNSHRPLEDSRISNLLLTYISETYRPDRMKRAPLGQLLRFFFPSVLELSELFTDAREDRRRDYFNHPPYRSAYLLLLYLGNFLKCAQLAREARPRLGSSVRILDLGAGPASASLGLLHGLVQLNPGLRQAEILAMDRNRRILQDAYSLSQRYQELWPSLELKFRTLTGDFTAQHQTLRDGPFDHVIMANAVNELLERKHKPLAPQVLLEVFERLPVTPSAYFWILEPSQQASAVFLQELRDSAAEEGWGSILAPCTHQGPCCLNSPHSKDWCHTVWPWTPPDWLAEIQHELGHRGGNLKTAYMVLQRDPSSSIKADLEDTYRVISEPMQDAEGAVLLLCGRRQAWRLRPGGFEKKWRDLIQDQWRGGKIILRQLLQKGNSLYLTVKTDISAAPDNF